MGTTYYDYQHNGTLGRQTDEAGGVVQVSWMKAPEPSPSVRDVRWNARSITGTAVPFALDNGGTINLYPLGPPNTEGGQPFTAVRPGYTNFRVRVGGKGVTTYHDAPEAGGGDYWADQVDLSAGSGLMVLSAAPQPAGAQYIADGVIWPKHACADCGADTVVHTIASWSGAENELWYWRGVINGSTGAVTYSTPVQLDVEPYITGAVEAFGSEVTVAYIKSVNNTNADVMYIQSTNCGQDWGTPVNITNYSADGPQGANTELALIYDPAGDIHILWNTVPSDGGVRPTNLYHWDEASGNTQLITTSSWANRCDNGLLGTGTNNGAGNANAAIADIGVTIKPAGLGPGAGIADELMYAVWTQYKSDSVDCATVDAAGTKGGMVNGEIWWSVSSNGGSTWDRPQNMTGTVTPDCLPGDCHSEAWSTVSTYADSAVVVSYVDDLHGGDVINGNGVWTDNPYSVMAVEARLPVEEPVIAVTPQEFIELNAKTTGTQTAFLTVASVGNADLTYTVEVQPDNGGQSHVQVEGGGSYSNTIIAGSAADAVTISYDGQGLPDPSEQNWILKVTSNDVTNGPDNPIYVTLQVFVADEWYTCEPDTISTGQHRLQVSSCLEIGDQNATGGGFYNYSDSTEWMYSGSPIITLLDGSAVKHAYRNMFMQKIYRTREFNQSFKAVDSLMSVTRDASADVARGTAVTTDTIIKLDYEVTAFKAPALQHGAVWKLTMSNISGGPLTSVDWGVAADIDVTSDSSGSAENIGIGNKSQGYIGQQSVSWDTTGITAYYDSYAALFHVDFAAGCNGKARAAQVLDNNDYVYGYELAYPTDSVYELFDRFGADSSWGTNTYNSGGEDTASDLNCMMITAYDQTLADATPKTWGFGFATSDISQSDLEATIGALRLAANEDCVACPISATGDVNLSGSITSADIIYLVGYVFKGGPPAQPCAAAGDVNCSGSVTSADIIYLVGYVFKGGNPPCDVCTLVPGTWTCP